MFYICTYIKQQEPFLHTAAYIFAISSTLVYFCSLFFQKELAFALWLSEV
jgi:hypothetical protein